MTQNINFNTFDHNNFSNYHNYNNYDNYDKYDYFYHDTLDNLLDEIPDNKLDNNCEKMNIEEKLCNNNINFNNIHFKYYDMNYNNLSLYDITRCDLQKINFDEILNSNYLNKVNKVNKVNNFKELINSNLNMNRNLISCKCDRKTKNLNKFITMFSGPNNQDILNEIVNNNLHNKI